MRFVVYQSINKTTIRNDVIKLTIKKTSNATNVVANVDANAIDARAKFANAITNANKNVVVETTNAKTIVHTNDTNTYKTMRDNASTRKNVRFNHDACAHRNDKNDRAKCRKLMQSNATTFVYVDSTNENASNA